LFEAAFLEEGLLRSFIREKFNSEFKYQICPNTQCLAYAQGGAQP